MRIIASLAAFAALAACSNPISDALNTRQNAGPCPPTGSLYDAARIVEFADERQTYDAITYTGEIVDVRLYCRYVDADDMEVELEIDFALGRGELGTEDRRDYEYFVAVTRRSGKVLAKENFTVEADFSDGPVTGATELVRPIIVPRLDETISGANFEVLVGFVLTEDQVAFNREGNRFRLDVQ